MKVLRISAVLLLIFVAIAGVWFIGMPVAISKNQYKRSLSESRQLLGSAETVEEREAAAGRLGGYFEFRDGSWVIIRYRDTHTFPGYSMALALDSSGIWYLSRKHFCGRIMGYKREKEIFIRMAAELGDPTMEEVDAQLKERFPHLHSLAESQDLTEAQSRLLSMGFAIVRDP